MVHAIVRLCSFSSLPNSGLPLTPIFPLTLTQDAIVDLEKNLETLRVALFHLESHVLNLACEDYGSSIGQQLVLPLLQDKLERLALEFREKQALSRTDELLRLEQDEAERQKAEAARKQAQKEKQKQKK